MKTLNTPYLPNLELDLALIISSTAWRMRSGAPQEVSWVCGIDFDMVSVAPPEDPALFSPLSPLWGSRLVPSRDRALAPPPFHRGTCPWGRRLVLGGDTDAVATLPEEFPESRFRHLVPS